MLDRISELRQQGEAAVAGAIDTGALEDVRVLESVPVVIKGGEVVKDAR